MAKFRTRALAIEAFQSFDDMSNRTSTIPDWGLKACVYGVIFDRGNKLSIRTIKGAVPVGNGDWIVRNVHGVIYSLTPEVFSELYELIPD